MGSFDHFNKRQFFTLSFWIFLGIRCIDIFSLVSALFIWPPALQSYSLKLYGGIDTGVAAAGVLYCGFLGRSDIAIDILYCSLPGSDDVSAVSNLYLCLRLRLRNHALLASSPAATSVVPRCLEWLVCDIELSAM